MWGRREEGYRIFQVTETTAAIEQCKVAEKMEDLFDEIVVKLNSDKYIKPMLVTEKSKANLDLMSNDGMQIYGAIWTKAGLTYVARYINYEWKTIDKSYEFDE